LTPVAWGIEPPQGRFQLVPTSDAVHNLYLLDTKTGFTWRNVACNNGIIANCWQLMTFVDVMPTEIVPIKESTPQAPQPRKTY
jgi:hypothetical protein